MQFLREDKQFLKIDSTFSAKARRARKQREWADFVTTTDSYDVSLSRRRQKGCRKEEK